MVIDDDPVWVQGIGLTLDRTGYAFVGAHNLAEARQALQDHCVDLILADETLGRESGTKFLAEEIRGHEQGLPCIVISGHADLEMALKAMRAGAVDMLPKPFTSDQLVETLRRNLKDSETIREARRHRWHAAKHAEMGAIVGNSPAIQKLIAMIRRVAATDSTVLIQGESGTGKELVAQAIHHASHRKHRAMVAVNIGSLPPTLLESTLFGVRKGAYTGADSDRPGLFEVADNSTLFLDEIGEATSEVQVRLLRALEERAVTRLGDTIVRAVDVRLIAATNRDLKKDIESGKFRSDLYYRLNVVRLQSPALRDRVEDIESIARHLLADLNRRQKRRVRGLDKSAIDKLKRHDWPGNVRELRNVIESAVIRSETDWIVADDIDLDGTTGSQARFDALLELPRKEALDEFDRRYMKRLLDRAKDMTEAAKLAKTDRANLYKILDRLGMRSSESATGPSPEDHTTSSELEA